MAYRFSSRSLGNLVGVHPDLVAVVRKALTLTPVDFMVIEGVRTPERQKELYAQGRTKPGRKVTWTLKSNHFVNPKSGFGHAVDLLPAPYDWREVGPFNQLGDAMMRAASELGVAIRWGADWNRNGKPREKGETDSPHFELAR